MKFLAIALIICTVTNVKKTFGFVNEHNSLNRENARECHTFYITTNVNITGGNTVINFSERKKHPNCPENDDPIKPTYLPYPEDCGKFYKCCAGFAYLMNCPAGLHWSIELDRCEYPDIANCDPNATTTIRTTSEPTKEPTQPTERTTPNREEPIINHPNCPADEDPMHPTHLPYPGNCSRFYKCCRGDAYPMDCPVCLHWSIEFDRCDYPNVAKCDPNATTTIRTTSEPTKEPTQPTERTTPNTEKPIINHPNCPEDENPMQPIHLPYPGNCGKFYKCFSGDAYPVYCPAGLHWSIELDRCDYPDIANCDPNATTTIRTTSETTKEPTQPTERTTPNREEPIINHPNCPVDEDPMHPTHLPYPGNCSRFYKCCRGDAYPMDCPVCLHWSIEFDRCDYPNVAKCDPNATTTIRTTSEPTKEPTQPTESTTPNTEKPIIKHPNCPEHEDPIRPTHLPYPGNCAKFYKCFAGDAYPMDCPADLHWSIEFDRCDYPEVANCDPNATTTIRTTSEPTKEPTQPTERTTPNREEPIINHPNCPVDEDPMHPTHLPYPGNCSRFYKCCRGDAYPMDCPADLHWSIEFDRCDYPEVANCDPNATTTIRTTSEPTKEPTQPTESTTPNTEKPIIKHPNCPEHEDPIRPTHLPYPGNCAKFYKCFAGDAYPMDCPAGLHWSIELYRCDYPDIANCDPNATTTIRTTSETTKEPTQPTERTTPNREEPIINHPNCPVDEDPMHPTHLPYPGNCSKFYKCFRGDAYPMDCPACLHWSIEFDRCDYPNVANCDPNATTTIRTTNEPTKEPTQPTERTTPNTEKPIIKHPNCPEHDDPMRPTHLPYPGNCAKFYKCFAGDAYPMDCPSDLHWSIEFDRCDYPEVANCDPNATTTIRTTSEPTKEPTQPTEGTTPNREEPIINHPNCPVDEDPMHPTHLPYPGNCSRFYKCCRGDAYPMDCPVCLHWSIEFDRCDYPNVAKCDPNATTTIRTTIEPTKEPTQPTESTTPNTEKPIIKHPNCPEHEDPIRPTHLPYPGNCAKFYKCVAGDAYPMHCPAGLHWSIELDRCDYPEVANCDPNATTTIRTTSEPTKESTQPTERTTPNREEPIINHPNCPVDEDPMHPTHLPYPGNCSKFYKCCRGDAYPMDCPACLHWSIEFDRCDYPNVANCDPNATTTIRTTSERTREPTQPTEIITPSTEKPIIKHPNCPEHEDPMRPTHLPYPGNCAKFYKCVAGDAYPMNCPADLHWSIEFDRCDYPEVANCDPNATTTIRTTSEPTKEPTEPTERTTPNREEPIINHPNCPVDEDPMHATHLPYPGNCSKFYKCFRGDAYPMDCPACLHWSIEFDRCDYPNIANCDPNATTTIRTTSERTREPTQPTEITTPSTEKPIIKHPNCPVDEDPMHPTNLPYPGNCAKFYKCFRGDAYPMDCPSGLHWSITFDRCDYPEVAKCDPYATTTLKSNTVTPPDFDEDKPFRYEPCPLFNNPELEKTYKIYFPYPKKCNKYLKCSYGFAVPTYCPQGLHWSTKYSRCDWPHNAHCLEEI